MPESRIVPITLAVCVVLATFVYSAIQCVAHGYVDRFWATHSNGGRCLIAQEGVRFMRQFAMFAHADQLDRLGEVSCHAHFLGDRALQPGRRQKEDPACNG